MAKFFYRLQNMDIRILQLGMIAVVVFALFNPMGLAVPITGGVQKAHDTIDNLPPDSLVLFVVSTKPGNSAEHNAFGAAMLKHLVRKQAKIAFMPLSPDGTVFVADYTRQATAQGYVEGVDFVYLPFRAGSEKVVVAMADNFKKAFSDMPSSPLMDSIKDIKSFSLYIDISGGDTQLWAIAHVGGPHNIPVIAGVNSNMIMNLEQYLTSGQLAGLLGGLAGGAQYEVLTHELGKGVAGMDAQNLGYVWMLLLLAVGNIGYLVTKKTKAAEGGIKGE